jgi:2-C-methyl-D-erythritol 2,4-cyclodiphosphate synthase
MNDIRIGNGFDVHAFIEGDHIVLGGVTIPHNKAFKAHSDGDVLLHALCDALLGALALGDIGQHFPDTAAQYENIDSRLLLRDVVALIIKKGYRLQNVDCIISAQAPKMMPHIEAMRNNIADDLQADFSQVSVKATTTERLGFEGREEGISAQVVLILIKE